MTAPDRSRPLPRVLVLRALGLGDLLTAVPALRALRRHFAGYEIVLAGPGRLAEAVAVTGVADRLLPASALGRAVPQQLAWRGAPPQVAIDLHGCGPASLLPLARLAPGRLLAYAQPDGPVWREDEHERVRWCRLLEWHGIPADPDDLHIAPPSATRSPAPGAVVVHPGADAAARRWPAERFALLARVLTSRGHRVVVTAGAGEKPLARAVAAHAELRSKYVLGGRGDVPFARLAALVATARAVIVGDTALAHLASALGTPSVVLFGPVSPAVWGPPPGPQHCALWHGRTADGVRPGDAHGGRPDERLLRITVGEVLDAFDTLPTTPDAEPYALPAAPGVQP
ncbi:MAG: glycosyltransferase family 9 protein [Streptomycetaceae bacterium]|nr:glycosyltransferase family 9 protein [Streptomycetaceae bacterium]